MISAGWLPGDEYVRDRLAPRPPERESRDAEKLLEANSVQKTKCEYLLDVPRRRGERFVVRERAGGSEVKFVRKRVGNQAADRRRLTKG